MGDVDENTFGSRYLERPHNTVFRVRNTGIGARFISIEDGVLPTSGATLPWYPYVRRTRVENNRHTLRWRTYT